MNAVAVVAMTNPWPLPRLTGTCAPPWHVRREQGKVAGEGRVEGGVEARLGRDLVCWMVKLEQSRDEGRGRGSSCAAWAMPPSGKRKERSAERIAGRACRPATVMVQFRSVIAGHGSVVGDAFTFVLPVVCVLLISLTCDQGATLAQSKCTQEQGPKKNQALSCPAPANRKMSSNTQPSTPSTALSLSPPSSSTARTWSSTPWPC
ncbi:hypothetical protein AMAG_17848 [Allomyces macrogynus ATCC 38327]|uniref:Uncharacterized protein n=1 Tax=Allomyces macrogynus (strain ATCC 38327) TaxID=578462 RepID=A0A0L0RZX8_ALLM3|nr:hypothetical protein AMAG_17848 [Allomyces macrogynus ATCC 38327]|eukprot:KNE55952.1 hypothetical protein AMAG_17848 [Allomyces macrogynus ATCC 38327]